MIAPGLDLQTPGIAGGKGPIVGLIWPSCRSPLGDGRRHGHRALRWLQGVINLRREQQCNGLAVTGEGNNVPGFHRLKQASQMGPGRSERRGLLHLSDQPGAFGL
jgi:hypothetical protein